MSRGRQGGFGLVGAVFLITAVSVTAAGSPTSDSSVSAAVSIGLVTA